MNPGGPGGSGISMLNNGSTYQQDIGDDFHFVSFDPRGVGLNRPYECPDVGQDENVTSPDYVSTDTMISESPEWFDTTYNNYAYVGKTCASPAYKEAGELVGTAFVARDVKAIAESLGEDCLIRYYGFSYGTFLGSTIAAMFPDQLDRAVLDGNINFIDYLHDLGAEAIANYDNALRYIFNACAIAGQPSCAVAEPGKTGDQLLAEYLAFIDDLRQQKIAITTETGNLTYSAVAGYMDTALKSGSSEWPATMKLLSKVYAIQNQTAISPHRRQFQDPKPFNPLDTKEGEGATLAAITCGDTDFDFGHPDGNTFREYLDVYKSYSELGYDRMDLYALTYSCATWQVDAREQYEGPVTDIETRNPILFVNGPYDPVTPLISAQNTSSSFVGSVVLQHNGTGHCSSADPSVEVTEKVRSYFQTGKLPDVSTIAQPVLVPFAQEDTLPAKRSAEQQWAEEVKNAFQRRGTANYPDFFKNAKRDVYERLLERDADAASGSAIPSGCTPVAAAAGTSSSTAEPPTGGASRNFAGCVIAIGAVLLATV